MVYQKYTAWRPPKGLKNAVTLTYKLVRATDQIRLPCEFGSNPFSGSPEIFHTQTFYAFCKRQCFIKNII